jgi:radical SAM protein with 4Fe4S-binding SPASM domain
VMDLFKKHEVHFSVHYDGLLDDPKLLSRKRRDNIVELRRNGFTVTALVVGTIASLRILPDTIAFFKEQGIRFYRLNFVSSQGRGHQVSRIPPQLRAEMEFESAFMASQADFATRETVILNKFNLYYNNIISGQTFNATPRPQRCLAGIASAYVDVDGLVYPCSFFTQVTGPITRVEELPDCLATGAGAIARCAAPNPYYDDVCRSCSALPICGEYCALSPVSDTHFMESFCASQRNLCDLMGEHRDLAELIAKRFIAHKQNYPMDRPASCGVRTQAQ